VEEITISLNPEYTNRLERMAKTIGKSCEDTLIHILEYESGLRDDPPLKPISGKEAAQEVTHV